MSDLIPVFFASVAAPLGTCKATASIRDDPQLAAMWFTARGVRPLAGAAGRGWWHVCQALLSEGHPVVVRDFGLLLVAAAHANQVEVVRLLLQADLRAGTSQEPESGQCQGQVSARVGLIQLALLHAAQRGGRDEAQSDCVLETPSAADPSWQQRILTALKATSLGSGAQIPAPSQLDNLAVHPAAQSEVHASPGKRAMQPLRGSRRLHLLAHDIPRLMGSMDCGVCGHNLSWLEKREEVICMSAAVAAWKNHADVLQFLLVTGIPQEEARISRPGSMRWWQGCLSGVAAASGSISALEVLKVHSALHWETAFCAVARTGEMRVCEWLCGSSEKVAAGHLERFVVEAAGMALFAKQVQVCVRFLSTLPVQALLRGTCVSRVLRQLRKAEQQCWVAELADQLWGVVVQGGPVDITFDAWIERVSEHLD